jgi:hypothetical protein
VKAIYSMLRGIMIAIGITPPQPGKEKWVAVVFFGVCGLFVVGMVLLGAWILRGMG